MNKTFTWSEQQEVIFSYFATGTGHAIVQAGAGSAKTTTSIEGMNRAMVKNAIYIVFNKKNQLEAKDKITNPNIEARTWHSVGLQYVTDNWPRIRGDAWTELNRIRLIQPDAPKQVMFQADKLVKLIKNLFASPTLKDIKDTANIRGIDCGAKNDAAGWTLDKLSEIVMKVIQVSLERPKDGKISFDDMVWLPIAKGWLKKQFDLIVVDEAQDANPLQLALAIGSVKDGGRICMVGDEHQSMYYFRGAASDGMGKAQLELNAQTFPLTTSYRCPKSVIKLAQTMVPEIQAAPNAIEGEVNSINLEKAFNQIKVGDVVLSRTNAPLMKNCLALIRKGIPAYVEGKDVAKNLINIVNQLEANTIAGFLDNLQRWQDIQIAKATGFTANQKIDLVTDQAETLKVIAEDVIEFKDIEVKINSLFQDKDYVRVPSVVFSTIHKSKGLEWNNVNVLTESFKTRRSATPEEIREEHNIRYVAYTRAKQTLNLVAG